MKYFSFLFFAFISIGSVFADQGWYTITQYHVDMNLHEDASMDVVEQIDVNFSEPRHGIYRGIPLQDPYKEYISLNNISVDNDPIASESRSSQLLSLKIGDKDTLLSWPKRYTIRYTVENAIKSYSGWTELYRNVIWNGRQTTIDKSSRTLHLPKNYQSDWSGTFAVWWTFGERFSGQILFTWQSSQVRFWTLSSQLNPGQGITIGMKFASGYFIFPTDYEQWFQQQWRWNRSDIWLWIGDMFPFIIFIIIFAVSLLKYKVRSPRKSDRPIALQYTAPKNIEPAFAFYLWYNTTYEPKIFTSLLYYRATKWRAVIQKQHTTGLFSFFNTESYHIIETSNNPKWASEIDTKLLQKFFGPFDNINDDIPLTKDSYTSIGSLLSTLSDSFAATDYTKRKEWRQWFFGIRELTDSGKEVFEHLRWYKEYLTKVEQPVIEQELKSDPNLLNKILPRAVLFGVETRLLKMVEEVLKSIQRYQSDDGSYLTYHTFRAMNSSFTSYSTPPRSSSSSGFSWGGGFSGWWWGGWWGWSR